MSKVTKHKIVEIIWVDSCGNIPIWEFQENIKSLIPCSIISVGYLLESTKEFVTIAQSLSSSEIGRRFTIPRGCIKKMRTCR